MIITADLHIKKYTSYATLDENGRNSRMVDCIHVLQHLCELALADDKKLFIAGDLFDERDFITTEAYYMTYQCLKDAKEKGVDITIELGNHEMLEKLENVSALYPFESVARVVSHPMVIRGHCDIVCLPWLNDWSVLPEVMAQLKKFIQADRAILIGHVPVIGAVLGASNYRLREGCVRVEDLSFNAFTHVVLGHYHKAQHVSDNVHYVGSPIQLNFGEAADEKRALKFNMKTFDLTSIPLDGSPKFYEGAYQDGAIHVVTDEEKAYGFLKVYCRAEDDLNQVQKAIEAIKTEHHFRSVQVERIKKESKQEVRLAVNAATKDFDVISDYVGYVPTGLDKQLLLSLGGQLLTAESAEEFCVQIGIV